MLNLLKLPCFETHRLGMSILFLIVISIIYGLLGNIVSMEVIIFITFSVYLLFLVIYVGRISKEANQTSNDPNWYLYNN